MGSPQVSVVIPSFNRFAEIHSCLDGFAQQRAPRDSFEVIVVDDGSEHSLAPLASRYQGRLDLRVLRRPHRGVSAARNEAIDQARAPLIVLGEDDVRPLPSLVEYCLDFHTRHPDEGDALLLYFTTDSSLNDNLLLHFLVEHMRHYFGFPRQSGIYGESYFWGGSISCKKSLFEYGRYDRSLSALEDTELGNRIAQRVDLKLHFERLQQATYIRDLNLPAVLEREERMAYFRCRAASGDDGLADCPWYERPNDFLLNSKDEFDGLRRRIASLEARLEGVNPRFSRGNEARSVALLYRLYAATIGHAAATGWLRGSDEGSHRSFDRLIKHEAVL